MVADLAVRAGSRVVAAATERGSGYRFVLRSFQRLPIVAAATGNSVAAATIGSRCYRTGAVR